jgi:hypothetical protein
MMCGNIDWAATGTMLYGLGTILGALAIFGAAWLGSQTFNSWRLQNLSERKVKQAERILTATYKARRQLAYVRNGAMWAAELNKAEESLKAKGEIVTGDKRDHRKLIEAQAYYNRLNDARDVRVELDECLPMARALFGHEVEQALEALNHHFHTVQVYVDANHRDKEEADRDFRRKIESTIWSGYPPNEVNELDVEIEKNVSLIEDVCVPALRLDS